MNHWFTSADAPIVTTFVKRFDPLHWTVDFPGGTIASAITTADGHGIELAAEFLRKGDLVGLIFESADMNAHPAHARETARDYSHTVLSFHWRSTGVLPLDQVNGPTLTIEGRDADGNARSWFVRLWNYASGAGEDADVTLDFDSLVGGYSLPDNADPVFPGDVDRMFLSIIPPDYEEDSQQIRSSPASATVTISGINCTGSNSVVAINDAVTPEHTLRIATGYDDMYNLPPERVVDAIERLGFRGIINHYIGMSHYFALAGDGLLDPARALNDAALAWHQDFARAAAARGYDVIWSLSYEILDMFCPDAWKQRAFDASVALTAWDPPSTLISPANSDAVDYLGRVATQLAQIADDAGLQPMIQIGEPWWWVTPSRAICLYDEAAKLAFGGNPVDISDVKESMSEDQLRLLDEAGSILEQSTSSIASSVRSAVPSAKMLLLVYLPSVLDPEAPEIRRANLPTGWTKPAFDVLQLEDYEWVTSGQMSLRMNAYAIVQARLGYAPGEQHYFSGFVAASSERAGWRDILAAAADAQDRGIAEVFLWALPQVLRDGLTLFGEAAMTEFDDVNFPIDIGAEASVAPGFSTNVVTSASGYEYRNANWQQGRLRFDAGPGVRGDAELETLIAFFRARRGAAVGFRFRDPYDFSSAGMTETAAATDQQIGTGDGTTTRFPLVKSYSGGEQRRVTRPVAGTVSVAIDGIEQVTGWTLEPLGEIVFTAAPAAGAVVTVGYLFDVPVRFATDRLDINRTSFLAGEAPSVPLIEIRED